MPRLVPTLAIAGVATALLVGGGTLLLGGDDPAGAPEPPSGPVEVRDIALDDFDTTAVAIARDAFCERVPDESVATALGRDEAVEEDEATQVTSWGNGDDVTLADGSTDVAHEFGCRYESTARPRGAAVDAWVYAPPVTSAEADGLREAAAGEDGCTEGDDAPAFGSSSVALVCTQPAPDDGPGTTTASFRGLFGDAWLTCRVSRPGPDDVDNPGDLGDDAAAELLDRAGRWCVTVARAAEA